MKYLIICLTIVIFYSCNTDNNSPEALAKTFCNCSENLGNAIQEKKKNKISDKEFEKTRMEWIQCMGPSDPRASMSEDEVMKFDEAYKKAVLKKCPNIARNNGFN